jgi:hypothetical protein
MNARSRTILLFFFSSLILIIVVGSIILLLSFPDLLEDTIHTPSIDDNKKENLLKKKHMFKNYSLTLDTIMEGDETSSSSFSSLPPLETVYQDEDETNIGRKDESSIVPSVITLQPPAYETDDEL